MNIRTAGITACIAAVLVIGLRVADFLFFFDKSVGFFTNFEFLSSIGLLLCLIVLVIRTVVAVRQKIQISTYKEGKSIPLAISYLISALGLSAGSWLMYVSYAKDCLNTSITVNDLPDLRVPFIIASLVFALYSIFSSVIYFMGKDHIFVKYQLLELIPSLWGLLFVSFIFIKYSVSIFPIENAYVLLSACSILLFQINKAAYVSDIIKGRACQNKVKIFSSVAICIGFAYCISNLVLYFLNISYSSCLPLDVQVIMISAFLQVPCFMLFSRSELRDITELGMPYRGKRFKNPPVSKSEF